MHLAKAGVRLEVYGFKEEASRFLAFMKLTSRKELEVLSYLFMGVDNDLLYYRIAVFINVTFFNGTQSIHMKCK